MAWDVVNEAVADDGSGLRDTVFRQKLGEGYLELAFRAAHEADPDALLVYNDYGAEGLGRKSDEVYALVRRLRDARRADRRRGPADARGGAEPAPVGADIAANMRRLARARPAREHQRDGRAHPRACPATSRTRLEVQRREYRGPRRRLRGRARCHAVTFWGFTDRYSWIDSFFGPDDPLLFDEAYAAKPAFFGVQDALRRR